MICKFNHEGDCCNSGATQYMCKCKRPCAEIIPITNADFIRALNDKDLRNFLCGLMKCEGCGFGTSSGCKLEEWLEQPAREENNDVN